MRRFRNASMQLKLVCFLNLTEKLIICNRSSWLCGCKMSKEICENVKCWWLRCGWRSINSDARRNACCKWYWKSQNRCMIQTRPTWTIWLMSSCLRCRMQLARLVRGWAKPKLTVSRRLCGSKVAHRMKCVQFVWRSMNREWSSNDWAASTSITVIAWTNG